METRIIKLGFYVQPAYMYRVRSFQNLIACLSDEKNTYGRILLTLKEYLEKYSKAFDEAEIIVTDKKDAILNNGILKGIKRMLSTEEIDLTVQISIIHESSMNIVDFSYPFEMFSAAFVIRKPEYKAEVFGILKTFSWQFWISIF